MRPGASVYEGGGIFHNLPYCKNIPVERTIRDWLYVDRLTGLYEEMGVSINREPHGPLTCTLVLPCISHAAATSSSACAVAAGCVLRHPLFQPGFEGLPHRQDRGARHQAGRRP